MEHQDAESLLAEARLQLAAAEIAVNRIDQRRYQARFWFSLNQAWAILTGASLPGSPTIH